MIVFAGCDGGGTKCVARVVGCNRSGEVVTTGQARSGPANVHSNEQQALKNILAAVRQALVAADVPSRFVGERLVAGLAGARDSSVQATWSKLLAKQLPFRHVQVLPDVELLFAEHMRPSKPVVASIVGTGATAYFRDEQGRVRRGGGGGPREGDWGSAFWMGRQAIARSDQSTELGALVGRHFRTDDVPEVRRRLHDGELETARVAQLAPSLFLLTASAASEITDQASALIADILIDLLPPQPIHQPYPWVCGGGVAVHQEPWLESIRHRCAAQDRFLTRPHLMLEPVTAAVRLARA